jgi:hypothetical protein
LASSLLVFRSDQSCGGVPSVGRFESRQLKRRTLGTAKKQAAKKKATKNKAASKNPAQKKAAKKKK